MHPSQMTSTQQQAQEANGCHASVSADLTVNLNGRSEAHSQSNNNTDKASSSSSLSPQENYPTKNINYPHPHDVLCGRGGATNNHIGNSHWRMLVNANKQLYVMLPKRQKQLLSRSVVHAVRSQDPPGRFLQKDNKNGLWFDVGEARALEKTSQALREGAPQLRQKLTQEGDPSETPSEVHPLRPPHMAASQDAMPPAVPPVSAVEHAQHAVPYTNHNPRQHMHNNMHPPTVPACFAQASALQPEARASARPDLDRLAMGEPAMQSHPDQIIDEDAFVEPPMVLQPGGFSFGSVFMLEAEEAVGQPQEVAVMPPPPPPPQAGRHSPVSMLLKQMEQESHQQVMWGGHAPSMTAQPMHPAPNRQTASHSQASWSHAHAPAPSEYVGPPAALQPSELSFGSIAMTDAEQARLEYSVQVQNQLRPQQHATQRHASYQHPSQAQHGNFPTHVQQQEQHYHPSHYHQGMPPPPIPQVAFAHAQSKPPPQHDPSPRQGMPPPVPNVTFGPDSTVTMVPLRHDYDDSNNDESAPHPVDYGLEPAGFSAGSMMSFGTLGTLDSAKLETAGMSFGSVMSITGGPPAAPVDEGLNEIGASFGSMSLVANHTHGSQSAPPPPPHHSHGMATARLPPSRRNDHDDDQDVVLPEPLLQQRKSKGSLLDCSDTESENSDDRRVASAHKSAAWEKLQETFAAQQAAGQHLSAAVPPSLLPVLPPAAAAPHAVSPVNNAAIVPPPPAPATMQGGGDDWRGLNDALEASMMNRGNSD